MANSQQSIIDRAFRIANATATDGHASPVIDNLFITEDLFRSALQSAVIEEGYQRTFSLTLTNGAVELPSGILMEGLRNATLSTTATDVPTSFEARYMEFLRAPRKQLNYATVKDSRLLFRRANGAANAYNGNVQLTVLAMPEIPNTLSATISMPDTLADKTAEKLAMMLRVGNE